MFVTSPMYSLKGWGKFPESCISHQYGVTGSRIIRRRGRRHILEKTYAPTNPRTSLQQANRSQISLAVASWRDLSEGSKGSWNYYQMYRRARPVMTGYNLYIKMFMLTGGNPKIPPGQ